MLILRDFNTDRSLRKGCHLAQVGSNLGLSPPLQECQEFLSLPHSQKQALCFVVVPEQASILSRLSSSLCTTCLCLQLSNITSILYCHRYQLNSTHVKQKQASTAKWKEDVTMPMKWNNDSMYTVCPPLRVIPIY